MALAVLILPSQKKLATASGQIVMTISVDADEEKASSTAPICIATSALTGAIDDSDRRQNDATCSPAKIGLFSSLHQFAPDLKLWIITEWDRA